MKQEGLNLGRTTIVDYKEVPRLAVNFNFFYIFLFTVTKQVDQKPFWTVSKKSRKYRQEGQDGNKSKPNSIFSTSKILWRQKTLSGWESEIAQQSFSVSTIFPLVNKISVLKFKILTLFHTCLLKLSEDLYPDHPLRFYIIITKLCSFTIKS